MGWHVFRDGREFGEIVFDPSDKIRGRITFLILKYVRKIDDFSEFKTKTDERFFLKTEMRPPLEYALVDIFIDSAGKVIPFDYASLYLSGKRGDMSVYTISDDGRTPVVAKQYAIEYIPF